MACEQRHTREMVGKVENAFLSNLPLHHLAGLVSVYCGYMAVLSNRRLKLGYRARASAGCISCCLESLSSSFPAKHVVFFRSQSGTLASIFTYVGAVGGQGRVRRVKSCCSMMK